MRHFRSVSNVVQNPQVHECSHPFSVRHFHNMTDPGDRVERVALHSHPPPVISHAH